MGCDSCPWPPASILIFRPLSMTESYESRSSLLCHGNPVLSSVCQSHCGVPRGPWALVMWLYSFFLLYILTQKPLPKADHLSRALLRGHFLSEFLTCRMPNLTSLLSHSMGRAGLFALFCLLVASFCMSTENRAQMSGAGSPCSLVPPQHSSRELDLWPR